jgi:hypothetical protein
MTTPTITPEVIAEAKRLYEVKHAYYCNEGNYFASGADRPMASYPTWALFVAAEGDSDMDYNLLFRWDWQEGDEEESNFTGDIYYRNGKLLLFWMGQRKGLYRWSEVSVCRADEPAVREWLQPRLDYLVALWSPLSAGRAAERARGEA